MSFLSERDTCITYTHTIYTYGTHTILWKLMSIFSNLLLNTRDNYASSGWVNVKSSFSICDNYASTNLSNIYANYRRCRVIKTNWQASGNLLSRRVSRFISFKYDLPNAIDSVPWLGAYGMRLSSQTSISLDRSTGHQGFR